MSSYDNPSSDGRVAHRDRSKRSRIKWVLAALVALILVGLLGSCLVRGSNGTDTTSAGASINQAAPTATATATTTVTAEPEPINLSAAARKMDKQVRTKVVKGEKPGDLRYGDAIDLSKVKVEESPTDFHKEGEAMLKTPAHIKAWFKSGSPEAKAAKARVIAAIKAAGYGQDEVNRALSGEGYLLMQVGPASQIMGTSYFVDGKVKVLNEWRQAEANDLYWLFFTSEGDLVKDALLRFLCKNPGADTIRIVTPSTPPAPPVTCYKGCKTPPPSGGCEKNCGHTPPGGGCEKNCNPGCTHNCEPSGGCEKDCVTPKNPKDHPANTGDGPSDPWSPAPKIDEDKEPATNPGGGEAPTDYTPPKADPEPTKTPRPSEPPPVESPAPKPTKPEPSPTQDPCKANPDFCD